MNTEHHVMGHVCSSNLASEMSHFVKKVDLTLASTIRRVLSIAELHMEAVFLAPAPTTLCEVGLLYLDVFP